MEYRRRNFYQEIDTDIESNTWVSRDIRDYNQTQYGGMSYSCSRLMNRFINLMFDCFRKKEKNVQDESLSDV
jgi:hypothetical protein